MADKLALIVDDEPEILFTLKDILEEEGFRTIGLLTGEEAVDIVSREVPDIVILDIWLPGMDGIEVLKKIKETVPDVPVIMISGHGTIETAVKAVKLGAYDFIEKPIDLDKLLEKVDKALTERNSLDVVRPKEEREIIGTSPKTRELIEQIELVGPTDCWVLITGESGVGKELVARMIHKLSPRKDGPFVEVNCAAIAEEYIEIELFGEEKSGRKGKFEVASGGTLYLDEIGDMSLRMQAKVLRVLEELKIERVGSTRPIDIDIRVIASTNKDIEKEIKKGNFRRDLFYRLNVFPIRVPPLRERPEDIPLLVRHFIKVFSKKYKRNVEDISEGALGILMAYEWPGNVRELKNLIERVVILAQDRIIKESDIPYPIGSKVESPFERRGLKEAKEAFEKEYILMQLRKNDWNITKTAEDLGIERSHLYKKLRIYGIKREENEI